MHVLLEPVLGLLGSNSADLIRDERDER